jgi:hypothetical protein
MERLYLCKVIGDGITPETSFRPVWLEVIDPTGIARIGQTMDTQRYKFWIGVLDTDDTQHLALVTDPRVRYISPDLMATTISNLTADQKTAILEVFAWLGFPTNIFSNNARVADVVFYMIGRAAWRIVKQAADA